MKSAFILYLIFVSAVISNVQFKINNLEDGCNIELPKNKNTGKNHGEDSFKTTPLSLSVADGVGGCKFSSKFLSSLVVAEATQVCLKNKQEDVKNESLKDFESRLLTAINLGINKFAESVSNAWEKKKEKETIDSSYCVLIDTLIPADTFTTTTTFITAFIDNSIKKTPKIKILQKGDSLLAIFRLKNNTLNNKAQFYELSFVTSDQQVEFNKPFQFISESNDLINKNNHMVFEKEILVGDIVIVGSDGLFDNVHVSLLTLYVNMLVKMYVLSKENELVNDGLFIPFVNDLYALFQKKKTLLEDEIQAQRPANVNHPTIEEESKNLRSSIRKSLEIQKNLFNDKKNPFNGEIKDNNDNQNSEVNLTLPNADFNKRQNNAYYKKNLFLLSSNVGQNTQAQDQKNLQNFQKNINQDENHDSSVVKDNSSVQSGFLNSSLEKFNKQNPESCLVLPKQEETEIVSKSNVVNQNKHRRQKPLIDPNYNLNESQEINPNPEKTNQQSKQNEQLSVKNNFIRKPTFSNNEAVSARKNTGNSNNSIKNKEQKCTENKLKNKNKVLEENKPKILAKRYLMYKTNINPKQLPDVFSPTNKLEIKINKTNSSKTENDQNNNKNKSRINPLFKQKNNEQELNPSVGTLGDNGELSIDEKIILEKQNTEFSFNQPNPNPNEQNNPTGNFLKQNNPQLIGNQKPSDVFVNQYRINKVRHKTGIDNTLGSGNNEITRVIKEPYSRKIIFQKKVDSKIEADILLKEILLEFLRLNPIALIGLKQIRSREQKDKMKPTETDQELDPAVLEFMNSHFYFSDSELELFNKKFDATQFSNVIGKVAKYTAMKIEGRHPFFPSVFCLKNAKETGISYPCMGKDDDISLVAALVINKEFKPFNFEEQSKLLVSSEIESMKNLSTELDTFMDFQINKIQQFKLVKDDEGQNTYRKQSKIGPIILKSKKLIDFQMIV